ncbi:MAG: hypothetical protein OER91_10560 [Gammaproteobacteria bacterium]|nr:hypothetical protein [Gammaproteobacteria bacterium]
MRVVILPSVVLTLLIALPGAALAQDPEIQALRAAIDELRADYDARIEDLERRLAVAEQNATQANYAAQQSVAAPTPVSSGGNAAFNPAIGVVFQGFLSGVEGEPGEEEGFAVGETELIMSANVDDKFTAYLTAALALEDGESELEIEEAWVETTALPAGFSARFGRMFSGIGYQNARHMHTWDFADQALAYDAFLDGRYVDNGIQVRWLAPTDLYVELGGEIMQGEGDPSGLGAHTVFGNVGGDVGTSHSWLAGLSHLEQDSGQRLDVAHFVWKWAPDGNWRQKNLVVQAEYLENRDIEKNSGWYAQAVYQPVPRWRFGTRVDAVDLEFDDPRRFSVMLDWSNSEFSRLRLQASRSDSDLGDDSAWTLQYIHSIGAHGAHSF